MAWAALYAVEKRDRATLSDDQVIAVLAREVKTRRESVEAYRAGGREDLAAKEEAEIAILAELLPHALGADEVAALVAEAIAATGAASPRDLGKVMGWLSPRTRGRADGKVVSGLVAAALACGERSEQQRQFDILQRGQDGDEVEGLEDEPDIRVAPVRQFTLRERRDVRILNQAAAAGRPVDARDEVEQGALARTARSHQGDELPASDIEADAVEGAHLDIALAIQAREFPDLDNGRWHGRPV
jgi:uncharacterized protein YqeY